MIQTYPLLILSLKKNKGVISYEKKGWEQEMIETLNLVLSWRGSSEGTSRRSRGRK